MTNFPHGGKWEIFCLPYVLDLIDLLEQKFCPDSKLRVKLMHESVKSDVLKLTREPAMHGHVTGQHVKALMLSL